MVEPNWHSAGRKENCDPVPNDQRARMIDLELPVAVQLDREDTKRAQLPKGLQNLVKVLSCHGSDLWCLLNIPIVREDLMASQKKI